MWEISADDKISYEQIIFLLGMKRFVFEKEIGSY